MQENKDLAGVNGIGPANPCLKTAVRQVSEAKTGPVKETEADFASWLEDILHTFGYKYAHFRPARVMRRDKKTHEIKEIYETPVSGDAAGLEDYFVWHEVKAVNFWAEIKNEDGQLSGKQKLIIASHRRAGITVYVWRPSERESIMKLLESPQAGQAEKV